MIAKAALSAAFAAAFGTLAAPPAQAQTNSERAASDERIISGGEVLPGRAPWAASLRKATSSGWSHFCGGSFIEPQIDFETGKIIAWLANAPRPEWLLTAAHCVVLKDGTLRTPDSLSVLGGTRNIAPTPEGGAPKGEQQRVLEVFVHPEFERRTLASDIAILRLEKPQKKFEFERKSIRLPKITDMVWIYEPYTAMTTAGWGRTEKGSRSPVLLEVTLPLVDRDLCQRKYDRYGDDVGRGMICAGFISGEYDSCQGDSGGGLFYRPPVSPKIYARANESILIGVVSWGRGCGNAEFFGIYTNVAVYVDWIRKKIESAVVNDPY